MARFSLGGDEDGEGEGSRSPTHKRPRLNGLNSRRFNASTTASTTTTQPPPPPPPQPPQQLQIVEEEDERVYSEEDSESESDVEEDDDEESPGNEDDDGGDTEDSDESDEEEEATEITIVTQQPPRVPRRLLVGRAVLDRSVAQYLARENNPQVGSASGSLASTATAAGVQEAPPSISPSAAVTATDASIVFTLTESDVLDCFICCEPLTVPVYQCENGHIACSSCCTKSKNKCPTCSWPIGYNRCRAIENVLEAIRVSCQNIKHGCKESITYNKKNEHEKACMFSPCSCPQSGCNFVSPSKQLYQHFSSNHVNSATRFRYNSVFSITLLHKDKFRTLQEQNDGTLFILDNEEEILGNLVSISCIQPSFMGGFYYDLLARTKNGKGSSLRFQSFAKSIPGQVNNPSSTDHFIIPCGFFETGGSLKMDLRIWRNGQSPQNLQLSDSLYGKSCSIK